LFLVVVQSNSKRNLGVTSNRDVAPIVFQNRAGCHTNWQLVYVPKEPVSAPKGSRLECVAHHDNSSRNKYNPDPTKEVRSGDQTWEEMMIGWLDYTIDNQNLPPTTAELK
jgi:hypothetical protein